MDLSCCICNESYDTKTRAPVVGTCGHSLCKNCRVLNSVHAHRCPTCRRYNAFEVETVNYLFLDFLDRLKTDQPQATSADSLPDKPQTSNEKQPTAPQQQNDDIVLVPDMREEEQHTPAVRIVARAVVPIGHWNVSSAYPIHLNWFRVAAVPRRIALAHQSGFDVLRPRDDKHGYVAVASIRDQQFQSVNMIELMPDGRTVALVTKRFPATVFIYDVEWSTSYEICVDDDVQSIKCSNDVLVIATGDGVLQLKRLLLFFWRERPPQPFATILTKEFTQEITPHGTLTYQIEHRELGFYDCRTKTSSRSMKVDQFVRCYRMSDDEKYLAVFGGEMLGVYSMRQNVNVASIRLTGTFTSLLFTPESKFIVLSSAFCPLPALVRCVGNREAIHDLDSTIRLPAGQSNDGAQAVSVRTFRSSDYIDIVTRNGFLTTLPCSGTAYQ